MTDLREVINSMAKETDRHDNVMKELSSEVEQQANGKKAGTSTSIDYKKLEERMKRRAVVPGTEGVYTTINLSEFYIKTYLELLDFIDQEPVMRWFLNRVNDATDWCLYDPGVDYPDHLSLRLSDSVALRWTGHDFGWEIIYEGEKGREWKFLGFELNIDKIRPILEQHLSGHEYADLLSTIQSRARGRWPDIRNAVETKS
jgi:hypothetical protein